MSQPDADLRYAAEELLKAVDESPVYAADRVVLRVRCAVQAIQLATVSTDYIRLLTEADELAVANRTLKAQAERDRAEITRLRGVVASYHTPEVHS